MTPTKLAHKRHDPAYCRFFASRGRFRQTLHNGKHRLEQRLLLLLPAGNEHRHRAGRVGFTAELAAGGPRRQRCSYAARSPVTSEDTRSRGDRPEGTSGLYAAGSSVAPPASSRSFRGGLHLQKLPA